MLGPVDYIAVGFKGNNFNGEIIDELQKVIDKNLIRIIDLLFILKDETGQVSIIELENMPAEIVSAFNLDANSIEGLLSQEDAEAVAADLENNSSAGVLVFEHLWAKGFKQSVANANGVLLAEGRIHPDDVEAAEQEITTKA
ncbi:MAG TPA: DUF6325 family protein [Candidatus Saccharimonadales bacterium]